jgi:hypothetical protein
MGQVEEFHQCLKNKESNMDKRSRNIGKSRVRHATSFDLSKGRRQIEYQNRIETGRCCKRRPHLGYSANLRVAGALSH